MANEDATSLWLTRRLWWPVERVPLQIEVVHPRKLTALEWVLLRVVDAFPDAPPTLEEAATELGVADAVLLMETLRDVVRLRALQPREGTDAEWSDLPDLEFTSMGREHFQRGLIEGEPAVHGVALFFDALTDEAMPEPPEVQDWTDEPFPADGAELTARSTAGLDRVRRLVKRFSPDLLRGDGEVRSVLPPEFDTARTVWMPVDVDVAIDAKGEVTLGADVSALAMEVLDAVDPVAEGLLPARSASADRPYLGSARCSSGLAGSDWAHRTTDTLAVGQTIPAAIRLVERAKRQVALHTCWHAIDGVQRAVDDAAQRGVRVHVLGAAQTTAHLVRGPSKKALVVYQSASVAAPGLLVVDQSDGLLLDDVQVRFEGRPYQVELCGHLSQAGLSQAEDAVERAAMQLPRPRQHRARPPAQGPLADIMPDADGVLDDQDLMLGLARLAATGTLEDFTACVHRVAYLTPGPERVSALVALAGLVTSLHVELEAAAVKGPAVDAWVALVEAVAANHLDTVAATRLAALAPPGAPAEALLNAFATSGHLEQASLEDGCEALVAVRGAVDARWGGGTASTIQAFVQRRRDLLSAPGSRRFGLKRRLAAAGRLLDAEDLQAWARDELDHLAGPADARTLERWVAQVGPLSEVVPDAIEAAAGEYVLALAARSAKERPAVLATAATILRLRDLQADLLAKAGSVHEVGDLRSDVLAASLQPIGSLFGDRVRTLLPAASSAHQAEGLEQLVADLATLGADEPAIAKEVALWASEVVRATPTPSAPEGLIWWLAELRPVRRLLKDLRAVAAEQVQRFRGALVPSMEAGDDTWTALVAAWTELGLQEADLVSLLTTPTSPSGGKLTKKKKKRRRRR